MALKRWKLVIEYNGARFNGWQRQNNLPTVQLAIEDAFRAFCQQDLTVHAAGRTDAGVHAAGQVIHIDLDYGERILTPHALIQALNAHLRGKGVVVAHAEEAAPDFHARFHAVNKLYRYRVVSRSAPPVLERGSALHLRKVLDVDAMRRAAPILVGTHDFTTFRATECQAKSPIRTLDRLDIIDRPYDLHGGVEISFEIEGRSFLHHQVRNMVGSLLLIGEGRWSREDLAFALAARDRRAGGPTVPPDGLSLERVDYPK